jgi:hypothetical protein
LTLTARVTAVWNDRADPVLDEALVASAITAIFAIFMAVGMRAVHLPFGH